MTDREKKEILDNWWTENHGQLWINVHKVLGYSQVAIEKWGDDLLAWSYEQFTKKPISKQYEIYSGGKLEFYITRGMALAIKSSTSPFYHHYRRFNRTTAIINKDSDYQGRAIDKSHEYAKLEGNEQIMRDAVASLNFYDKFLITEYYYNKKSAREIARITDIAPFSISRDIKKALHKIKRIIENKIDL